MKAMILAAGRGERLRPLTDQVPKPLLPVARQPLVVYTIAALVASGYNDLVINIAHLGQMIKEVLGNGERFGATIQYSDEGDTALETAGGIRNALPLLGDRPFLVVNGDLATDFPFAELRHKSIDLAHLVLVANPEHHPQGDFGLQQNLISENSQTRYTFSGIGVYHPHLFSGLPQQKSPLGPVLRQAAKQSRVSGQLYRGFWMDIGTPQRLKELEDRYNDRRK